jgi:hypothetical protein
VQGASGASRFTKPPFGRVTFLDFSPLEAFKPPQFIGKIDLFDPPTGLGGRRLTPDSAMRPRAQTCLEYLILRSRVSGVSKDEARDHALRDAGFACSSG